MEDIKGIFKRELDTIEIHRHELGDIIINTLLQNGYDVTSKAILDKGYEIGEVLTISRISCR